MKKILCLSVITLLVSMQYAFSAPAYPYPIDYQLPDGSNITIQLRGDEHFRRAVSEDGYTMLFNADGFLEYAVLDDAGNLQLSGVLAHKPTERTGEEQAFLQTISKQLHYSEVQKANLLKIKGFTEDFAKKHESRKALTGTVRIPVILVEFQDKQFSTTKREFELLFNQLTYYTPGSLRDYFFANSYGQLDLKVDVFGPYQMPGNVRLYDDRCNGNPRTMARLAIDSAYERGNADFSNYAIGDAETVDAVHIIFAGYGGEAGAPQCNSVHSHAWKLSSPAVYNGKTIVDYSCSPELRGNAGTEMTYIGVIAHELGHSLLKLPDFYDADGADINGVTAVNPEYWCLMASGNWVDNGRTPSNFSAYAKDFAGWVNAVTISEPMDIFLPNPMDSGVILRINTKTENEYFLIENRQRVGQDAQIPYNSGMMIYHVNKNHAGWLNNSVNDDPKNRGYYVEQAGCADANGCSEEREYDAWGQLEGKTEFTDFSTPNAKSASGENTEKPITNIVFHREERTITFKFMGGTPPTTVDIALSSLQIPDLVQGAQTQNIIAKIDNLGKQIDSLSIDWYVNGVAQTPVKWHGELAFEKSIEITLGTLDLQDGKAYKIRATAHLSGDTETANNTATKTLKVFENIFSEDFEGETGDWTLKNGNQTNAWHIGNATSNGGEKAAYISNNQGVTNAYTLNAASAVHLYRDVEFPAATDSFDLFFDFKGVGQTNFTGTQTLDYLEVRLVANTVNPLDSVVLSEGLSLGTFVNAATWQTVHKTLSPSLAETSQRLVFSWYNDRTGGTQTPAALDNIKVFARPAVEAFSDIVLSVNELHSFGEADFGYEPTPFLVTVANTGTTTIDELTLALSGTHAENFELSKSSLSDIEVDTQSSFTIAPKPNLKIGTYTATVTVSHSTDISEHFEVNFVVLTDETSSIYLAENEEVIKIFPNPVTNGELNITVVIPAKAGISLQQGIAGQARNDGQVAIEIYDLQGRCVYSAQPNSPFSILNSPFTIDVSHLPKGTYIIKIGAHTAKIVKM